MQVGSTGKASGTRRGYIDAIAVNVDWVSGTNYFVRADYGGRGGDSGGPVFRNNAALGIHSGGTTTWSAFGRIHYATYDLGVTLMTRNYNDPPLASFTASCGSLLTCSFNGRMSRSSWNLGGRPPGDGAS
jgi:hypothetical protein